MWERLPWFPRLPTHYDTLGYRELIPKNDLTVAILSGDNAHIAIQGSPERKVKKNQGHGGGGSACPAVLGMVLGQ